MIDLHCHLLPGIDDGAADLSVALEMARIAYADGIRGIVCTPHVKQGVYDNGMTEVMDGIQKLRKALAQAEIRIEIFTGADVHIAPNLGQKLKSGEVPTIAGSRYFLFEPSHHVMTPRIVEFAQRLIAEGHIPIVTHPERLTWLYSNYDVLVELNDAGCLIQVTAGSLTGDFGKSARLHAERMLEEGRIDILATDAHDTRKRPPILSRARDLVAARLGEAEAREMVLRRPVDILANRKLHPQAGKGQKPSAAPISRPAAGEEGFLRRWFPAGSR